jgi:putative heme iron utilization protein
LGKSDILFANSDTVLEMIMTNRPDFSQQAKDFFVAHNCGVLSTISNSQSGFPFGSLTPYDVNSQGEPIIYISLIAEHYKNLVSDRRASICVTDPLAYRNPQAGARVTVLVEFDALPENQVAAVQAAYQARFPDSINHEIAHNFRFMCGRLVKIRWIGGFGDIAWIDAKKFLEIAADPLSYHSLGIIEHMNDDHQDALVELARCKGVTDAKQLIMSKINSAGMTITSLIDHKLAVEIAFDKKVSTPQEARAEIIRILKQVR